MDAAAGELHDDVPAAVFCLSCGRADCMGCSPPERSEHARTPWEQSDLPLRARLFRTARLATVEGEAFFGTLDDGSVAAALSFALVCEVLAIGGLAIAWCPIVYALAPGFVESLLADGERRGLVLGAIAAAVPVLAIFMVALHVLWASGLEFGLRTAGAPPRLSHCLRYALYSCGWDLVTSPFGFAAGCASNGIQGAVSELRAAVRIPRFATVAYIGRARKVSEGKARRALFIAAVVTGAIVLTGAVAFGIALVLLLL